VNAAILKIGPLQLHWYGIIITAALLAGLLVSIWMARLRRERADHLAGILLLGLLAGVIGARAWYVAFNRDFYAPNPAEAFAVWEGGLALHGGLIGAIIATLIYTWSSEISFWRWADICVPGLILAQAIGRVGDLVNNQAFGIPTTSSYYVIIPVDNRPLDYINYTHFTPTAAYEAVWDFAVFLLLIGLTLLQRRGWRILPDGVIFLAYLIFYSIGRFPIEGLRVDSLYLGTVRVAQLASIVFIAAGLLLYVLRVVQNHDEEPEVAPIAHGYPTEAYLAAAAHASQQRFGASTTATAPWDTQQMAATSRLNGNTHRLTTEQLPQLGQVSDGSGAGGGTARSQSEEAS
jgi:phosphatidylglycerol:prolipoprotein diacylglycerol transferase